MTACIIQEKDEGSYFSVACCLFKGRVHGSFGELSELVTEQFFVRN